jgi:NAD(P)-dependent dehydrogenase (short-subunit alcohol dehydrogenase family)
MTITLITGANNGLSYETSRRLIGLGHTVLVGARGRQRGEAAARELGGALLRSTRPKRTAWTRRRRACGTSTPVSMC